MRTRTGRNAVLSFVIATLLSAGPIARPAIVNAQEPATVQACVNPRSGTLKIARSGGCQFGWIALRLETDEGGGTTSSGPRVVDANGKDVGAFFGQHALRRVGDAWLLIPVAANGFLSLVGITFYFPASDCVGDAYLEISSEHALARYAQPQGSTLHFGGDTLGQATMFSYRFVDTSGAAGECQNFPSGLTNQYGRDTPVDLNSLGLTLPFRISDGQQ